MCDVVIKETVKKEIGKKASAEQRAGLEDIVERYSDGGWKNVPPKKYNASEGWFPSAHDKRIRLEAFKPWALRAYGFCEGFRGRPAFFITGVDTSKKQKSANQVILARAGAEAVRLHDWLKSGGNNVPRG